MLNLIHREFIVNVPLAAAWKGLATVETWPTWANHIHTVKLQPAGELTAQSKGQFRLTNGIRSEFQVTQFEKYRRWQWVGPFLWLTIHYDHLFASVGPNRTKMTWLVDGEGPGAALLGRLYATVYNRNLNAAIPQLQTQLAGQAERK